MHKKTLYVALLAFLVINAAYARKTRRGKRPKEEEDESTPQPNVVTYSTFGFNDVNSYDGFVPSSPSYASHLGTFDQESSTRLYAPAFPTAQDTEYGTVYEPQPPETPNFRLGEDSNAPQASMLQYHQNSMNFYNSPGLEREPKSEQGVAGEVYGRNAGEVNSRPIYGAKLSSKNRNKFFNGTDFNGYSEPASSPDSDKYFQVPSRYENKPLSYGEPAKNYPNSYNNNNNFDSYPPIKVEETANQEATQPVSYKFPKVVDFTKFKQYYPTELDTKYMPSGSKLTTAVEYDAKPQNDKKYYSNFETHNNRYTTISPPTFKNSFTNKEETSDKEVSTLPSYAESYSNKYFGYNDNKDKEETKAPKNPLEFKDQIKYTRWPSINYTNDFKNWKSPLKGYQYSTNVSNMNFQFDFSGSKQPTQYQIEAVNSTDEYVPASSNHIEYSAYQLPETEYSNSPYSSFKKIPSFKGQNDDYSNIIPQLKNQDLNYDPADYVKSLYSSGQTSPTTTSSWGNIFKNSEYSYSKYHPKRPVYGEDTKDEIVHIGSKRPYSNKYNFGKYSDNKQVDWSSFSSRPHKSRKPYKDVDTEISSTRYKTEEDLLGLRTHDTSHPSYLPTSYRPSSSLSDDYDYKKLVEKWRQSYLRSKYQDTFKDASSAYDYESYPSETKAVHVAIPKPYPIEIPHPVLVPVPQPYPVQVPIPKPVAVPVLHELKVPVEKLVPYAVIKNVPYPVEKPVPVMVEKEVKVPVMKPYPVHVPHIRPVFHHTKPQDDMDAAIDMDEEYDYMPRPESSKKIQYAKRVRSSRNRTPKRPTRVRPIYPERNRRRWPAKPSSTSSSWKKPASSFSQDSRDHSRDPRDHSRYPRRPQHKDHQITRYPPAKPHEFEAEDFDTEGDYLAYVHCKRTGNC